MTFDIPARDHGCWKDRSWRTDTLHRLCAHHEIDTAKLAALTGTSPNTTRLWLGLHVAVIPPTTLRALLFELNLERAL